MATTGQCRACDNLVSKTAKFCPHCGEGKPYSNKGGLSWLLAVFLIIFVMGIMSENKESDKTIQAAQGNTEEVKQETIFTDNEIWLIKKRAERKDPDALYLLSYAYGETTKGLKHSPYLSLKLLEEAARLGQPDAQFSLSSHYDVGEGVPKNPAIAFELIKKAATSGKPLYVSILASSYSQGRGVSQNSKIANELFIKSANQGFGVSQAILATDFRNGHSVPKDLVQAYKWHNLAKMTGHPGGAASGFRGLSFDELLAEEMTEGDIKKGQRLINEFLIKNPQFPSEQDAIKDLRNLYRKVKEREDVEAANNKFTYKEREIVGFLLQDSIAKQSIAALETDGVLLKKGTQVVVLGLSEDPEWVTIEYANLPGKRHIPAAHVGVFAEEKTAPNAINADDKNNNVRERRISPDKNPDVINGRPPWVLFVVVNGSTYGGAIFPGYFECADAGMRAVWGSRSALAASPEKAKIYCQPENMRGVSKGVRVFSPGQRN